MQDALDRAWVDSLPGDARLRHEEGGWVYLEIGSGCLIVRRAPTGFRASIDLSDPPMVAGAIVVATFHTHPNPTSEGWYGGPSRDDTESAWELGLPCIIRADDGVFTTGPDRKLNGE